MNSWANIHLEHCWLCHTGDWTLIFLSHISTEMMFIAFCSDTWDIHQAHAVILLKSWRPPKWHLYVSCLECELSDEECRTCVVWCRYWEILILTDWSNLALDEKGGDTCLNQSSVNRRWMVTFRESTETKAKEGQKVARKYRQRKCLIIESTLKLTTLSLLMIHFPGTQAVLQGGGSYVGGVQARVWAPVTPAITNGSPSNPSSASPALQSKGTVSTHVKSRMEQEGHSGRRKEGGKGPAGHLHTPVILIYTGCQPPRSEFTLVAGATGLFSPSLAR